MASNTLGISSSWELPRPMSGSGLSKFLKEKLVAGAIFGYHWGVA
jgi:hypothetical protein